MRKIIVTVAGLLAYGSALAGGALPPNPDLYGSILVDDFSHRQTAVAGQPGVGNVPVARGGEMPASGGGALPPNPDLYGSILVDDLSHRQTAVAGQPGVGDAPGIHGTHVRHAVRRNAFVHPDLSQSILTDIGYNF
jgi:hypothetical protein